MVNGIKQMADDWILRDNRILRAVGGIEDLAREISKAPYKRILANVNTTDNSIRFRELDKVAKPIGDIEMP